MGPALTFRTLVSLSFAFFFLLFAFSLTVQGARPFFELRLRCLCSRRHGTHPHPRSRPTFQIENTEFRNESRTSSLPPPSPPTHTCLTPSPLTHHQLTPNAYAAFSHTPMRLPPPPPETQTHTHTHTHNPQRLRTLPVCS